MALPFPGRITMALGRRADSENNGIRGKHDVIQPVKLVVIIRVAILSVAVRRDIVELRKNAARTLVIKYGKGVR